MKAILTDNPDQKRSDIQEGITDDLTIFIRIKRETYIETLKYDKKKNKRDKKKLLKRKKKHF